MSGLQFLVNPVAEDERDSARELTAPFGIATAARVRAFHRGLPGYAPTPLHWLRSLARRVGVASVWLKDESSRFGLGAFKALGASYAVAQLGDRLGDDATLITASDGNHGRAVAWAARERGVRAIVYLPEAASETRLESIAALGAAVQRVPGTYDDAVARAQRDARENGWTLLQDTAWPGYEEVPRLVMQGYLTLVSEALDQLEGAMPTHVLLQCGVGSFAAAVIAHLVERTDGHPPRCILVEPACAACGLAAMESGADRPPLLPGDTHGFMACLSCGQLSHGAWPILRSWADAVVACPDEVAMQGMRLLARPHDGDPVIESGESGAVSAGLLELMASGEAEPLALTLGLSRRSRVLLVSTEGATDPERYADVLSAG